MKRYRVLKFDFDTRANILKLEENDNFKNIKLQIKDRLIAQFGTASASKKIDNFVEIGASPISIMAFHNIFLRQIRNSYVIGSYYPALVGACALGERILNQLIIHLRDDFKNTEQYKSVYKKNSFDNWNLAIKTLKNWNVLLPNVVNQFQELKQLRNEVIHFNPETDVNTKKNALDSIKKIQRIIGQQFSCFGHQPWYIPKINGAAFIKKSYEAKPFIKRIVIPNCKKVGPYHILERGLKGWIVKENYNYEEKEITDIEFAKLFNSRKTDNI